MKKSLLIPLGVLTAMALWMGFTYNKLIKYSAAVPPEWRLVEAALQARYDRIPGLIELINQKKYVFPRKGGLTEQILLKRRQAGIKGGGQNSMATPEAYFGLDTKKLLARITLLRERWNGAKSRKERIAIAPELDSALCELEHAYELMFDTAYSRLNNDIPWAIGRYNLAVEAYNVTAGSFPGTILVRLFSLSGSEEPMAAIPSWLYSSAAG